MEQREEIEKIMKRIRKLEAVSHPPVDWDGKIDLLAKKIKTLEQQIIKEKNNARS